MARNVGSFRTIAEECIDAEGIAPACRLSETKNPREGLILGGRNASGAGGD